MIKYLRNFVLGSTALAATLILCPVASADGYLTPQEEAFGDGVSGPLCEYIDTAGVSGYSMAEAMKIIYRNTPASMDMSDAVDIINYVVYTYCPSHWDELVAFGSAARGEGFA